MGAYVTMRWQWLMQTLPGLKATSADVCPPQDRYRIWSTCVWFWFCFPPQHSLSRQRRHQHVPGGERLGWRLLPHGHPLLGHGRGGCDHYRSGWSHHGRLRWEPHLLHSLCRSKAATLSGNCSTLCNWFLGECENTDRTLASKLKKSSFFTKPLHQNTDYRSFSPNQAARSTWCLGDWSWPAAEK